jgi:Activator of Hsp90 ATPase homolog 1-like protein
MSESGASSRARRTATSFNVYHRISAHAFASDRTYSSIVKSILLRRAMMTDRECARAIQTAPSPAAQAALPRLSINSTLSLRHRSCTQGVKLRYAMTKLLIYSLRVRDHLNSSWSRWFEVLTIKHEPNGKTLITSPLRNQAALCGAPNEDKGMILQLKPEHVLQYSHFSPLSDQADVPENYHTVTIELSPGGSGTIVTLSQDNNATEEDREHSEQNWGTMLDSFKRFLEKVG